MDDFELNLNEILVSTFFTILAYEERSLKEMSNFKVTMNEAHTLEAIGKLKALASVSGVASCMNIAVPTATVAIKKLESKGLATRTPCAQDNRKYIIGLTEAGKRVVRAHKSFHKNMVKHISSQFAESEKIVLLSVIQKLNSFFEEKIEGKSEY